MLTFASHTNHSFWATVCKTFRSMLSDHCLSVCLSYLSVTLVYCGQAVGWIKMKLGMRVGLGPGQIVLDRDPAPLPRRSRASQFLAHVYYGQTAGWIKMALGMQVDLGPRHIVLDGYPAPHPKKGAQSPIFGPFLLWSNCWIHQDAT